jgi:hypothetical protein
MTNDDRKGCAIAQAVSRWLPTVPAWVRARVWSCGICGGQSGTGAGILRVLRFPLPILIPPIASQSSSSITWGLYTRPEVAAVPSGLSPTPPNKNDDRTSRCGGNARDLFSEVLSSNLGRDIGYTDGFLVVLLSLFRQMSG